MRQDESRQPRTRRSLIRSLVIACSSIAGLGLVGVLGPIAAPSPAGADPGPRLRCDRVVFPLALASGQPASLHAVGWLCARGAIHDKTIQVLVHGATYDHNVWDFPYRPDRYSYVRAATDAGYATLNLDRLGHGQSSRVPGAELDLAVGAFALHQIVEALRSGAIVTHHFGRVAADKILLAGESLGGNLVWTEAAIYRDVDGLVVAGSAHSFGIGLDRLLRVTVPVEQDPLLRLRGFPPGYLTTIAGTRAAAYYHPVDAELLVILLDELLKQTITSGEIAGIPGSLPLTLQVDVPTLIAVGDFDDIFCAGPSCSASGSLDAETDSYGPGSCAELVIMPHAGHVLSLHRNARDYFALVREWADRRVGPVGSAPAPEPCDE